MLSCYLRCLVPGSRLELLRKVVSAYGQLLLFPNRLMIYSKKYLYNPKSFGTRPGAAFSLLTVIHQSFQGLIDNMISGSNLIFNYLKRIYFCDHSFFARFKLLHYVEIDAAGTNSLTLFGIALYCSVSNKRMFRGQYPTWDSANAFIRDLRRYWFKSLNILPSARKQPPEVFYHKRCS